MAGQNPKRSLPRGVLPVERPWDEADPASRVRPKAPPSDDAVLPSSPDSTIAKPQSHRDPGSYQTPEERARLLVGELLQAEPRGIAPIVRRLLPLGNFALEEIALRFPGPIWRPSLPTDSRLPRPSEISACAAALETFEAEAVPYLARLMQNPAPEVRYYATVVCGALASAWLIEPLAQVALDDNRDCRRVALHLLSGYQHEARYRSALAELRKCAADIAQPLPARRRAISALTQLRDESSAALLVELLADADRGVGTASRVGLRVLTAHDFGFSRQPWLRWLSERGHENRIQWLIEGLGDGRINMRLLASRELWHLTRLLQPLSEAAERDEFLAAQRHYRRWWAKHHPG